MVEKLIAFIVLIIPLIFHHTISMSVSRAFISQYGVMILSLGVCLACLKLPKTYTLFYVWCLIGVFYSMFKPVSLIAFLTVSLFLGIFYLMTKVRDWAIVFKAIAMAISIQSLWVFVQSLNLDFMMNYTRYPHMTFGTTGSMNVLGGLFLLSIIPIFLYKKWASILPILGVIYSKCSTPIIAMVCGGLFYLAFSNTKYKYVFMGVLCFSLLVSFLLIDNPFRYLETGRLPIWRKIINERTWFGNGVGTFKYEFPQTLSKKEAGGQVSSSNPMPVQWAKAHNTYLQVLREQGIVGFFIMIGIVIHNLYMFLKDRNLLLPMVGVVMLLVLAMGSFPFRNYTLAVYSLILLALIRRKYEENNFSIGDGFYCESGDCRRYICGPRC